MRFSSIILLAVLAVKPAAAGGPPSSTIWLVPSYIYEAGGSAPRRAEVSILNLSAETAQVSCHVYKESGEHADRASQVKTFATGSGRSNEGGSLPCAFAFADSLRGWAVLVSSQPVIAEGYVCEGAFCPNRTPLEIYPLDCRNPGAFAAACRHAPQPARAAKPQAPVAAKPASAPIPDRPPSSN